MDKSPGRQRGGNHYCKTEYRKNNEQKNEDHLKDLWDNIKHINIYSISIPEGEERQTGSEKISEEIIAENFPNMEKETVNKVQEVQRVPGWINPRRNTPGHTVNKMMKIKDKGKILKASREKLQIAYMGTPIRLPADFSTEILQARRERPIYFK